MNIGSDQTKKQVSRLCACGCGTPLGPDSKGRIPTWCRGHSHRGKKHSDEWKRKQSLGVKASWEDPTKQVANRHPSAEVIERRIAPLRGRKLAPEQVEQIRQRMIGAKVSAEVRAKIMEANRGRMLTQKQREALERGRLSQTKEMLRDAQAALSLIHI